MKFVLPYLFFMNANESHELNVKILYKCEVLILLSLKREKSCHAFDYL